MKAGIGLKGRRYWYGIAVAGAACAVALSACSSSTDAASTNSTTTVTVGIIGKSTADWPLLTAMAEGYFKQEGLSVNLVTTGSPVTAVDELGSGQVDIASDGTDSLISAIARHQPVEVIAPEMITDPYSLITSPSVTSWSQLKGKTVILGTTTDVTAMTFTAMAKTQGLSKSDFQYVTSGSTNTRYTALLSGRVQGAVLLQPYDLLAESKGYHKLASGSTAEPNWLFSSDGVNTNWAKSHGSVIVDYIRALQRGVTYDYAHPAAAEQIMINATKLSKTLIDESYQLDFSTWHAFNTTEAVPNADIQGIFSAMRAEGILTTAPSISSIYNTTYVNQANK
jgi:NitT/TauT family transport system substrate-binding protein